MAIRLSPRVRRVARRAGAAALLLVVGFLSLTRIGRYLARAGWEEAKILWRREPIAALVADPSIDAATRAKLALVVAARRFAVDSLGLDAGESFTTYSPLERDTLVLVLSGAYRDRLRRYTWWFPVVGRVPYKGFFDFAEARQARERLEADGYDAELRSAAAFSTLGWFNDPLLSTTLRADSVALVNTVIHELVHNTYYARGGAVFNESFANWVGFHGATRFFAARGDTAAARRSAAGWAYERRRGAFYSGLYRTLDSAFAAHPTDSAARIAVREQLYADARVRLLEALGPTGIGPDSLMRWSRRVRLNNAIVLARRVYLTDLDLFDAVLEREGGDIVRAFRRVLAIVEDAEEPAEALRRAGVGSGQPTQQGTASARGIPEA